MSAYHASSDLLHLAALALVMRQHEQRRQTNEHVRKTLDERPLSKNGGQQVPVEEPDESPVQGTNDDENPGNLVCGTHTLHHNDETVR